MKKVVFIPEVGSSIGLGHFFRSYSLACYLSERFEVIFYIPEFLRDQTLDLEVDSIQFQFVETECILSVFNKIFLEIESPSIVVLDGYNFSSVHQQELKLSGNKVVCIDDLHQIHFYADVIINQQINLDPALYSKEDYTKLYHGLDYVLLRKEFTKQASGPKVVDQVHQLVINMGGVDIHNISLKVLHAALKLNHFKKIVVITGVLNPHQESLEHIRLQNEVVSIKKNLSSDLLVKEFEQAQLAVLPSSTICLEACAVGIGIISGYTADNQKGYLSGLEETGAVVNTGSFIEISEDSLTSRIAEFIKMPSMIREQIAIQRILIDGKAPERIVKIFESISC